MGRGEEGCPFATVGGDTTGMRDESGLVVFVGSLSRSREGDVPEALFAPVLLDEACTPADSQFTVSEGMVATS